jgi:formate-nitrite transporter family protein
MTRGSETRSDIGRQSEEEDNEKAAERKRASAEVIADVVNREGKQELARPVISLFWSGLAAGLSMGFSLAVEGILHAHLPATEWRVLVSSWGYTVGFLIVILGRQQLFTENTLTVVLPVLDQRTVRSLLLMLRLWAVVLLTNLAGTLIFAAVAAHSNVFTPEAAEAFGEIGKHAASDGFWLTILQGIVAGWLIALMVWLLPEAGPATPFVIMIITYVIAIAGLPHVIAGSTEVAYAAFVGLVSWWQYGAGFLVPTLIGNIIGGVTLVALLNYGQVRHDP